MSRHSPPSTRDQIVSEALRLFSEQGYGDTSVSDIQVACGLSEGSGALYKHFRSKEEVLDAGIERELVRLEGLRTARRILPELGDLRAEAEILGRFVLLELADERDLLRVLFREGDRFPGVLEKAKQRLIRPAYEEFAAWLRRHVAGEGCDVEARATVALGAILQYRAIEAILGEPPGGMDEERFLAAWVDMLVGGLS